MQPRSIRIFLVDGTPDGVKTAEISNWTGKAIYAPRTRLGDVKARPELNKTGIYILIGPDPDSPGDLITYIGEGDVVWNRLGAHNSDPEKDFWTEFVSFSSKDEYLTKAHVRFLEARLLQELKKNSRVRIHNGTSPEPTPLPEADRADMETFLDHVELLLSALGMKLFEKVEGFGKDQPGGDKPQKFEMSSRGADAFGYMMDGGFVVQKDSEAVVEDNPSQKKWYSQFKSNLIKKAILKKLSNDLYTFTQPVIFSSPSAAASVVAGQPMNGPATWKINGGMTFKEWSEEQIDSTGGISGGAR